MPSGRCRPSAFGMYRRRTGGGRYVPARSAAPSSCSRRSTPYCSTAASVCPSTPAAAAVALHPPPRLPEDVIPPDPVHQRMEAALRGSLGRDPEAALQLAHFVDGRAPIGVVGTGPAGHALTLTCSTTVTTAGTLPSARVVRREPRHYYDPLGLPLRRARFRLRLIRAACPDSGCADGSLVFRSSPCTRAAPPTPPGPDACSSGLWHRRCCLRRDMSGSAPGLLICRGCRLHFMLRPACLLPP